MLEKEDKTKGHLGSQRKDEDKMKAVTMSTRSPTGLKTQIRRRGEHLHRLLVPPGLEMENGFLQTQLLHQALGLSQVNPPDGLKTLRIRPFANDCMIQLFGAGGRNSANRARPGDRSGECTHR